MDILLNIFRVTLEEGLMYALLAIDRKSVV